MHKAFARALRSDDPGVQSTGCVALCKLMLAGIISEPELLRLLVVAYFDPDTQDNAALRQALTYFLPAYCHSRRENMARMAGVAVGVVRALVGRSEELDEDDEMVGLGVVAAQLVDWTDERKLIGADGAAKGNAAETKEGEDVDVHLMLAEELLDKVTSPGCSSKSFRVLHSSSSLIFAYAAPQSQKKRRKSTSRCSAKSTSTRPQRPPPRPPSATYPPS